MAESDKADPRDEAKGSSTTEGWSIVILDDFAAGLGGVGKSAAAARSITERMVSWLDPITETGRFTLVSALARNNKDIKRFLESFARSRFGRDEDEKAEPDAEADLQAEAEADLLLASIERRLTEEERLTQQLLERYGLTARSDVVKSGYLAGRAAQNRSRAWLLKKITARSFASRPRISRTSPTA